MTSVNKQHEILELLKIFIKFLEYKMKMQFVSVMPPVNNLNNVKIITFVLAKK